jgi:hypothetical protein
LSNIFGGGSRPAVSPTVTASQAGGGVNDFLNALGVKSAATTAGSAAAAGAPTAPTPIAPPTMADPFSPATLEAQRKIQNAALQGGRTSTILTTRASRATGNSGGTIAGAGAAKLGAS